MIRRSELAVMLGATWALLAGCGSETLWARYSAERDFWHARRLVQRIQINPKVASPQDYEKAIAAFEAIVQRYPAARWAAPDRARDTLALEVAQVSGDAMIAVGRLHEMRGQAAEALAAYGRAADQFHMLLPVRLKAALARAAALERSGDATATTAAYAELGREYPMVDAQTGEAIEPVIDAPLRVAGDLLKRGESSTADSVLITAEARYLAELGRQHGRPAAPILWMALAQARASRGRADQLVPALEALRSALAEPATGKRRPRIILTMGEYCLRAGRPDSALAYANWAEREFGNPIRPEAMMLEARAWEVTGPPDSAVAAYGRFLDDYSGAVEPSCLARYRRGVILEGADRWELARTEYRALIALMPTHDLSYQSLERIVKHHLDRGERELAGIEGRRAIESLDQTIATNRDEDVLLRTRHCRARILLAIGDYPKACDALAELWKLYPQLEIGVSAGLKAAELAEQNLKDGPRAARLYEQIAAGVTGPAQQRARSELTRLRRSGG